MVAFFPSNADGCHVLPAVCHTQWDITPGPFTQMFVITCPINLHFCPCFQAPEFQDWATTRLAGLWVTGQEPPTNDWKIRIKTSGWGEPLKIPFMVKIDKHDLQLYKRVSIGLYNWIVILLKRSVDQKKLRKILTVGGPVAAAHKEGHPGLTFLVTTEVGVVGPTLIELPWSWFGSKKQRILCLQRNHTDKPYLLEAVCFCSWKMGETFNITTRCILGLETTENSWSCKIQGIRDK